MALITTIISLAISSNPKYSCSKQLKSSITNIRCRWSS